MDVYRLSFHWNNAAGVRQDQAFVTQKSKVFPEMKAFITGTIVPDWDGGPVDINITFQGQYRDTGAV